MVERSAELLVGAKVVQLVVDWAVQWVALLVGAKAAQLAAW